MSRSVTIRCDHCGDQITAGGSVVEVTAGGLRQQVTAPWDLCTSCAGLLVEFFSCRWQVQEPAAPMTTTVDQYERRPPAR
jgi:hypothetical protein